METLLCKADTSGKLRLGYASVVGRKGEVTLKKSAVVVDIDHVMVVVGLKG